MFVICNWPVFHPLIGYSFPVFGYVFLLISFSCKIDLNGARFSMHSGWKLTESFCIHSALVAFISTPIHPHNSPVLSVNAFLLCNEYK